MSYDLVIWRTLLVIFTVQCLGGIKTEDTGTVVLAGLVKRQTIYTPVTQLANETLFEYVKYQSLVSLRPYCCSSLHGLLIPAARIFQFETLDTMFTLFVVNECLSINGG